MLPPVWQARVEGFLLNKFRGDVRLLAPAPTELQTATGVPVVGVLPWLDHVLPDEEGPTLRSGSGAGSLVVIPCGPYASNLDEFVALQQVADVRFVDHATELGRAALVILPGSKRVTADLEWLHTTGLAERVVGAARAGTPILGICGGLQMLGATIEDPAGVDAAAAAGLGLLELHTTYRAAKRTARTTVRFGQLPQPWSWLSGHRVSGYEIRHGVTEAAASAVVVLPDGLGYLDGNVLGVYLHGLLEDSDVLTGLAGAAPPPLETVFDRLADAIEDHLDRGWLTQRLLRSTDQP